MVIGAGGVAGVCLHKMAAALSCGSVFSDIIVASRTRSRADAIASSVMARTGVSLRTAKIDADDTVSLTRFIEREAPILVVNLALPYQDLSIMDACLSTGVHYIDTANYEPRDTAKFEYRWQWDYHNRFASAGLLALLGAGFDPGATNVFTAWIQKHQISEIETLDILDCNAGEHPYPFATNFNTEINIREVRAVARHWEDGAWQTHPALSQKIVFPFPELGTFDMYLMYHEELESLVKHYPSLRRARFWMSFSKNYLKHLEVLENIGMTSIKPIHFGGHDIIPLQFLQKILPDPSGLGALTRGKTCIGVIVSGRHSGEQRTRYLYNICDHASAFAETGAQAISYTTGVPAMIAASLVLEGIWHGAGVFNIEQFDPDPFMARMNTHGLAWNCVELDAPLDF